MATIKSRMVRFLPLSPEMLAAYLMAESYLTDERGNDIPRRFGEDSDWPEFSAPLPQADRVTAAEVKAPLRRLTLRPLVAWK